MNYRIFILAIVIIGFVSGCFDNNTEPVDSTSNIEGTWLVKFYKDSQFHNFEKDSNVVIKVKNNILYWDKIVFANVQFFNDMVNTMSTDNDGWSYHLAITMSTKNNFEGSWGEMKINDLGGLYSDTKYVKGFRK